MSDKSPENKLILSIPPMAVNGKDAARLLGIGRTLFLQMDNSGRLGPMGLKLGKRRLWSVEELRAWVNAGCPIRERWQQIKSEQKKPVLRRTRDVI